MAVIVEWCGHSYVIVRSRGFTLAIDPHDGGSVGVATCRIAADAVLVTHDHFDHNAVEVAGAPRAKVHTMLSRPAKIGPFRVEPLKLYHDKARGALRGPTMGYILESEGTRIAHLGDVGHLLSEEEISRLGDLDLLMLPVGGVYTITAPEAWAIVEDVKPKAILPLHYWVNGVILPLDPLERFLEVSKAGRLRLEEPRFKVPVERRGQRTAIVVPPPPPRA